MTVTEAALSAPPRRRSGRTVMLAAAAAASVAAIPLAYLLLRLAESDPQVLATSLFRARTATLLANTVGLVLTVSLATLVLGVATAWLLTRTDLPARRMWLVLSALPLAIPSYVAAFGWVSTSGLRGFAGAWLVLTLGNTPLVTHPTVAALRQADLGVEDVARSLGRSRLGAFRAATWPQVRPAAFAGVLLAALYTLGDFGAVSLMRFEALTWAIHAAYGALFDRTLAAALAVILVLLALVLVTAERRARGAHASLGAVVGPRTPALPVRLGRWRWVAITGLGGSTALALGVPLVALARAIAGRSESAIRVALGDVAGDLGHTVAFAASGALVALVLALPIGYVAARRRTRASRVIESAGYLGLALPGIVVGLSLAFLGLRAAPALYQTAVMLAFAYGVLFLSKAVGAVRSSIDQVEPGLEDVARTLGASPWSVWRRVTSRIAWPGIGAGALLVALTAMKELPATLLLRPTGSDTLATSLWRLTDSAAYGAAAPYALTLVAVAAIPTVLLTRNVARATPRRAELWEAP